MQDASNRCAIAALLALALSGCGHAPVSEKKEVQIVLTQPWTRTGIQLAAGQTIAITAKGTMNWYTNHCNGKCLSTPDGASCQFSGFYAPHLACWSLIGQVGRGAPFQAGTSVNVVTNSAGELLLGVNDNNYPDNTGRWIATVEAPCPASDAPRLGDVVIYWSGARILHSGYVSRVDGCRVVTFDSYVQAGWGNHEWLGKSPDDPAVVGLYGAAWTVYRTNRQSQRKINTIFIPMVFTPGGPATPVVEGVTDKGTYIVFIKGLFDSAHNCHGFTFDADANAIVGYMLPRDMIQHVNDDENSADQSAAVKFILRDNGYVQLHAKGPVDSPNNFLDHYRAEFNP